ncbi:MAG: phenylalanine--tRNA ligase subunit beta [Methanomassiliicoccales archaeon]
MPVISFKYDDLIQLIGNEVPLQKILDELPMMGADFHSYDEGTGEIMMEFFPNRPDLYCVEGIARALRSFLGFAPGIRQYPIRASDIVMKHDKSTKDVRPFFVGGVVRNVTMSDELIRSLMGLQEKLHLTIGRKRAKVSIGIHDLDRVEPPFTYKAVRPDEISFVPLGKNEAMNLQEILERHEKGIEYRYILEGKEKYPIIVDRRGEVLSFPPIINGQLTVVTEKTRNILIDVTGTDFHAISGALNIVATAMAERGAEIETIVIENEEGSIVTPDLNPKRMSLGVEECEKLLGLNLDVNVIVRCLERMGYGCEIRDDSIEVFVPATRMDILHTVDLIEDVAIGYGYESFGRILPRCQTIGGEIPLEKAAALLRDMMVGHGYLEVTTLTLSSPEEQFIRMRIEPIDFVEILNPISQDHSCLRTHLLPSLLALLKKSKHRDLPQRIFEIGDVVIGTKRRKHIAAISLHAKAGFTEMKSLVESIMRDCSADFKLEPSSFGMYIDGRQAAVVNSEGVVGHFGEVHPEVLENFTLGYPAAAMEFNVERLLAGKIERVV